MIRIVKRRGTLTFDAILPFTVRIRGNYESRPQAQPHFQDPAPTLHDSRHNRESNTQTAPTLVRTLSRCFQASKHEATRVI